MLGFLPLSLGGGDIVLSPCGWCGHVRVKPNHFRIATRRKTGFECGRGVQFPLGPILFGSIPLLPGHVRLKLFFFTLVQTNRPRPRHFSNKATLFLEVSNCGPLF